MPLDNKHQRINREITAPQVRLVGLEGEQLGIVSIVDALAKAEAAEVDLVEIAPLAEPPVVRIMDYGKFKYRESKRAHEAKLKQKQIQVKEIKFRPSTDEGDYKIKVGKLIQFLDEGDKAKVTLRFRGREMAHQEFGVRLLERVRKDLEPHAIIEQFPRLEGRQMVMVLAPKKKVVPVKGAKKEAKPKADADKAPKAVKEVKFRPGTDEGDYKIKLRNLTRFLSEGDKAKVTMRFRGREMAHQEFGVRLLERIRNDLEAVSLVEQFPRLEGRQMVMLLAPKKTQVQAKPAAPTQAHHPDKPEAGAAKAAKVSPAPKPESTAVGSK